MRADLVNARCVRTLATGRLPSAHPVRSLADAESIDGSPVEIVVSLSRGRGRITIDGGRATIVARCPLCNAEHRYDKGEANGEEIAAIRKLGYTEEWLPCQNDLPGNFWRIIIANGRQGGRSDQPRGARKPRVW